MAVSRRLVLASALGALILVPAVLAATELVVDGGFEAIKDGNDLRRDSEGQDWYESRKDKDGKKLLKLSTKKIYGNKTQKAMIKGDVTMTLNTYLSQRLPEPLTGTFIARYDIAVKEIRPEWNRSAFFFLGTSNDKKRGPNSTGKERFVMLGFENAGQEGKVNLFAREGKNSWDDKTILLEGLDLKTWYTITVNVDVPAGTFTVQVDDRPASGPLEAFRTKSQGPPEQITHVSFATWNDGAGTFYVDNVSVVAE
jgi:hypothetical protein